MTADCAGPALDAGSSWEEVSCDEHGQRTWKRAQETPPVQADGAAETAPAA